jgi:2,4-didehydro-3-deoxy-L-rhamnonate hydrolase
MRIANVGGRLKVLVGDGAVDVHDASDGRFDAAPEFAYARFDELSAWAATVTQAAEGFDPAEALAPSPAPRQVFAIGLNYGDHAKEAGLATPTAPIVFTKFPSSITGPITEVVLPEGSVDWEIEVVAVIGAIARDVPTERVWEYVAGLTAGQDLSERDLQRSGPAPQFGLAKSFAGFSPMGPSLVTPDEFDNPDDLALGCKVNGVTVQDGRSHDMIFSIPELVSYLSGIVTLYPGDVLFTGTPEGVGMGRVPPWYLHDGDVLESWIEGIGELTQTFVRKPTSER